MCRVSHVHMWTGGDDHVERKVAGIWVVCYVPVSGLFVFVCFLFSAKDKSHQAGQQASDMSNKAQQQASDASNRAFQQASDIKHQATDKAHQASDAASQQAGHAQHAVSEGY